jgi:hypothetical protein
MLLQREEGRTYLKVGDLSIRLTEGKFERLQKIERKHLQWKAQEVFNTSRN